jgi:hypothetical protein
MSVFCSCPFYNVKRPNKLGNIKLLPLVFQIGNNISLRRLLLSDNIIDHKLVGKHT